MTRGRKRKTDADDTSPEPRARQARTRRRAETLERVKATTNVLSDDEYEVDATESQQLGQLTKLTTAPKTDDKEEFVRQVEKDKQELETLLEKRLGEVEQQADQHRKDLTILTLAALSTPTSTEPTLAKPKPTATHFPTNLAAATSFIERARAMLTGYDAMEASISRSVPASDLTLPETWAEEEAKTRRVLEAGLRIVVRRVEGALVLKEPEEEDGKNEEERKGGKEMEEAWKVVGENFRRVQNGWKEGVGEGGLVKSVRYAERGVARLAKGVPEK